MIRFCTLLAQLRSNERGIALVEFAYAMPLLITMGMTGLEVANYAIANSRITQIAMQTADNAARVRDSIDEADINELFIGARLSGERIGFGENGRIILSSLEPNTAGDAQWIRWQRCYGMKQSPSSYGVATPMSDSTMQAMGPAGNQIAAVSGTAVMYVEIWYDYQPMVLNWLLGTRVLHYSQAFNVRQRNDHVIKSGGIASGQWSTCDRHYA